MARPNNNINNQSKDKHYNGFPSPYVSNQEKNSEVYALKVFRAILDSTALYREKRMKDVKVCREYAKGEQSLQQYLDELSIEGNRQYVNINYKPTKILQKFEKIVVDDYQQLEEKPKAIAKGYQIQERKNKKKSDLRFRMQYADVINQIQQDVGFNIEDPNQRVPEDEDELDLITSLNSEEREELLMNLMLQKVFTDNDIESLKHMFLSDIFQVNFAGYHHYTDNRGKIKIRFVAQEDALYDSSMFEDFRDISFAGSGTEMTIGEIRYMFNIPPEKEEELWKLARHYRSRYGNYAGLQDRFNYDWRYSESRPYDDYTVRVYHVWKKTVKNVGYVEGKNSYGNNIFDVDKDISKVEYKSNNNKKTGVSYPETAYEGWFAGDCKCPVVLEWKEQVNQIRTGKTKANVECPYIFFMPDNRGTMMDSSAVERVIADIQTMDSQMLQIKLTLANHPPAGYAIDHEALLDVDLGTGEDLQPVDIEAIYQQTGRLYYRKRKEDGSIDAQPPIIPINISVGEKINTHLSIYNLALSNIRDTLGINPNREGTANLSRVSSANAETAIAVSQTATYYMYRAFLKSTEKLTKHIGIRIMDVLTYGSPDKGYLKYLGEENIAFINEREAILDVETYDFIYNPQMTKEEEEELRGYINAGITSRELSLADALMIKNIKDVELAEKYLRYMLNKNKKEAQRQAEQMQAQQIEGQTQMAERAEQAKQQTIQVQSELQAQEWKIKGESQVEASIYNLGIEVMKARLEGKTIPPEYAQLERLILDSAMIKQEKSLAETEQQLEQQVAQEQQVELQSQLEQAVQSGQMTLEEAEQVMMNQGAM